MGLESATPSVGGSGKRESWARGPSRADLREGPPQCMSQRSQCRDNDFKGFGNKARERGRHHTGCWKRVGDLVRNLMNYTVSVLGPEISHLLPF